MAFGRGAKEEVETMDPAEQAALAAAFLEETAAAINQEHRRIQHCFRQLSEEDVWRRPADGLNSAGTVVRHLCGNMRQWFLHGVGGEADVRDREAEFADSKMPPKDELLSELESLLDGVQEVLDRLAPGALLDARRIQGSDCTVLSAIYSTVTHLEGHAQQIVYITHLFLGDKYVPFWKPEDSE